jgi:hypothetical protein
MFFQIAFQTHFGQYEFRVMAFGLTDAPGSFQGAMNATLAPGLQKFVTAQRSIAYLGHIIGEQGVATDLAKWRLL